MASFLGGQEKADVASLAKQAGNVSFPFKTEDSYNFKQKCGMDKNKRVTWFWYSTNILDYIYPCHTFPITHERLLLCDIVHCIFVLVFFIFHLNFFFFFPLSFYGFSGMFSWFNSFPAWWMLLKWAFPNAAPLPDPLETRTHSPMPPSLPSPSWR